MAHPHSNLHEIYDQSINLSGDGLASKGVAITISGKIDAARLQGFRTVMQDGIASLLGNDGSGGPIGVGLALASLGAAKIKEVIDSDPQSRDDDPDVIQASRRIYWLGWIPSHVGGSDNWMKFNTKHRFSIQEGIALDYFIYNAGINALDADNQVLVTCRHLRVWLRD